MGMILVFSFLLSSFLCFLLLRNALASDYAMADGKLIYRQRLRRRQTTTYLGIGLVLFCVFFIFHPSNASTRSTLFGPPRLKLTPELLNNLSLDEAQCNAAFPGLTKEVDDMVAKGPFIVKQTGDSGPLQARIKDNQVCPPIPLPLHPHPTNPHQLTILHAQRRSDLSQEMLNVPPLPPPSTPVHPS